MATISVWTPPLPPEHEGWHTQRVVGLQVCILYIVPPRDLRRCIRLGPEKKEAKRSTWDLWGQEEEGSHLLSLDLCMCDQLSPGKEDSSILMASYSRLRSHPGQWAIRSKCWWLGHTQHRPGPQWISWTSMTSTSSHCMSKPKNGSDVEPSRKWPQTTFCDIIKNENCLSSHANGSEDEDAS